MKNPSPTVIPDRLIAAREHRQLSQADLAKMVGMSQQAIGAIESGNSKRPTKLHDIARALRIDVDYLLGLQEFEIDPDADAERPAQSIVKDPPLVRVPDLAIFGGMGGGGLVELMADEHGMPLDPDQLRGYWSFPEYMMAGFRSLRHIYAWEVRGDSMEPTLAGGSVVFVDMSQDRLPPDDIYAIDYGDGLMVKRLKLVPRSDRVSVISDNERYGVDELLREEVRVYGRVVGWFQWRK